MAAQSGESVGEAPTRVELAEVAAELRAELGRGRGERLVVEGAIGGAVRAPRRALVQALANLAQNAFDAVEPLGERGRVALVVEAGERVSWSLVDNGPGAAPEVLERLGEPFFTTKAPGQGTGLGIYLAGAFAERLGGRLVLSSTPGQGFSAELSVPRGAP